MDHADVRQRLDHAASEPGGLRRLEVATDEESRAVRRHLAACPACRHEADALLVTAAAVAWAAPETVRAPAAARSRVLGAVAAEGRPRAPGDPALTGQTRPAPTSLSLGGPRLRLRPTPGVLTGLAAAAALALLAGAVFAGRDMAAQRDLAIEQMQDYREVVAVTNAALSDPDHRLATLTAGDGSANGTVLVSPARDEIVMVAHGLPAPGTDARYRCFVERDGRLVQIGWMWVDGDIAYWAGPIEHVDDVGRAGDRIVVSREGDGANPVLTASF
jgi:hypothetical protein